jgi:hypothetical protein
MGLTIHYSLKTDCSDIDAVRSIVQSIRQWAKQLSFQEVGDIAEFHDNECGHDDHDDPDRWLKIQARQYVQKGERYVNVAPLHVIAFTTLPGDGSEPANFGLATYPKSVEIDRGPKKQRVRTNLPGWRWRSFCKTQYASNPACGGVTNFVRCHLCIVELLDAIQKHHLAQVEVHDESNYWDHRDVRKLAETVGEWNEMIAAVAGQLKDAAGGFQIQAPITQFADFEHLEAKGRDKRSKKRPT